MVLSLPLSPNTTPSVIPPTTHIDTTPIPTVSPTIPASPDYTPASPDYSPASDTEFDPSSDHIPPLPATSPFLSSTDDSSDSDIPYTPPSPTHVHHLQRLPFLPRDHLRSSFGHSLPTPSSGMRPSHHLFSLVPSIHHSSAAISEIPSHDSSYCSPSRKSEELDWSLTLRMKSDPITKHRRTDLEMDINVVRSDGIDIDPEISGRDQRVQSPAQEGAVEVTYETLGDLVQRFHDHTKEIPVRRVPVIESVQRDPGHRIVATRHPSADMFREDLRAEAG
ncbi:hypothetical protein Tco_0633467 [Tanacetum coccineum]